MGSRRVVVSGAMTPITETPEWAALAAHFEKVRDAHLRDLFADDPKRGTTLTVDAAGVYFDYSKHRLTTETVHLLVAVDTPTARLLTAVLAMSAVGFAIYLVALQAFVIDAWCVWCLVNDLLIVPLLAVLSVVRLRRANDQVIGT